METKHNVEDLRGVKCRVKNSPLLLLESTVTSDIAEGEVGYEYGALMVREERQGPFLFYLDLMKKNRLSSLKKEYNLVCVEATEDGAIYDTEDRAFKRYCEELGLKASDGIKTSRF
jgi:hypothetical protein